MLSPDRNYSWSTALTTCADFENDFGGSFINDEDGQEECDLDGFWIDMAAYCNCEGHSPSYACDFCSSGTIINPDLLVDAPEGSDLRVSLTCAEAGLATEYISDANTCLSLKLLFAPTCCLMPNTTGTTTNQTLEPGQCSICPSGSTMQNANRSLFFVGNGITCASGDAILAGLTTQDECAAATARLDALPLDVAAWCGCTGVDPPDDASSCTLCTQVSGGVVSNDEGMVDLGNNLTVTCDEADMLAPYINDATVCQQNYLQVGVRECCSGVPTAPVAPSPQTMEKPTVAPTFGTSGASHLLRSRGAPAFLSLVAATVVAM